MPPFAKPPPAMLQIHHPHSPPTADDELDSPTDSLSALALSLEATDKASHPTNAPDVKQTPRPDLHARSSTDPSPSSLLQDYFANAQPRPSSSSSSHRNRSPYSRSHLRSRSSGAAALVAPPMTRAHSLPNPHLSRAPEAPTAAGSPLSGSLSLGAPPRSPLRTPVRVRSPLHEEGECAAPRSPGFVTQAGAGAGAIESIQEDSELDLTPRHHQDTLSPLPQAPAMASFTRSGSLRRRPASPLHSLAQAPVATSFSPGMLDSHTPSHASALSSGSNSPSLAPQATPARFRDDFYPSLHHYASTSSVSSMPSTPTSARSRSPSISSLETLDEAPDMESEAAEVDHIERLKLAAERQERLERGEDDSEGGGRRRSSLDTDGGSRRVGFGFGRAGGSGRERKRWSICGGERRGDLDLETIWED
ncbi:hypothetical protein LTR53_006716 [Teratosphaeriaceae sp. CCFEE 6253]|nr:hypothetical protein LTR53_006716 [Teratosphaeriaceae sp. CCFEE 6253]